MSTQENIREISEIILKERRIMKGLNLLINSYKYGDEREKRMINSQTDKLKLLLRDTNNELLSSIELAFIPRRLKDMSTTKSEQEIKEEITEREKDRKIKPGIRHKRSMEKIPELDREILKRLKKNKKKVEVKKIKKPSQYVKFAINLFGDKVKVLVRQKKLIALEKDLIKSNLGHTPVTYISVLILTTIISFIAAIVVTGFFMFFNLTPDLPIIVPVTEGFGARLLKILWILFVVPFGTFLFMYVYPSLEKKSAEGKINAELPFATIHMAAISGSLIEPLKIFTIISSTKEYPNLEKEFNKLLNEINVYGYDIVTALKNLAINCPSTKLSELFNGLATTITSGGSFYDFFDKRAQSLLFDYKLDREKNTKAAETFMDIYISVVIAAPMILMLLLMMMKISGLGISLSTSMITFLVVGGVSVVNIFFLVFLQLKQPDVA